MECVTRLPDTVGHVTFPVHPRTDARLRASGLRTVLEDQVGVSLTAPLRYREMLDAIAGARVVVTDSGGLQEEASWLGVPVVVLRRSTPRWEGVLDGTTALVGLDPERATAAARRFASSRNRRVSPRPRAPTATGASPHASPRCSTTPRPLPCSCSTSPTSPPACFPRSWRADKGGVNESVPPVVLFDLDDTLYPQRSWLTGTWRAVATKAADYRVEPDALLRALLAVASEGSDKGRIVDRALALVGAPDVPVEPLVDAFRSHAPERLDTYPGTHRALTTAEPAGPASGSSPTATP